MENQKIRAKTPKTCQQVQKNGKGELSERNKS